jgi:hypothetical protein
MSTADDYERLLEVTDGDATAAAILVLADVLYGALGRSTVDGPGYLEALAISIAGSELQSPVGPALDFLARKIDRMDR